jgi:predicted acetyltransferase
MINSNYEGPRTMLPEEYDKVIDLAEKSYGYTKQYFLNYYPHTAKRENFIFEDHFVIKENGKLVSHVGLYPMEAIADSSKVKIGGIGDVGTHPYYQGKGYMGKLMNYSITKMKERKIPLSILWGDTQRYRHFGWETAGRKIVFHLSQRSIKSVEAGKGFILRGYDDKMDLEKIVKIHEKEPLRIKRSRKDYERLLERTQIQIWMGNEENFWGYAVLSGKEVIEFGGKPSLMAKLFSFILNHYSIGNLNVHLPYKDSEMLRTLYKISTGWEILPLGMIKIIDLKKTLFSFKAQIQAKVRFYKIGEGICLTFRMLDANQKASLVIGEEIEIKDKDSSNLISLSDIEMVRLLFGLFTEKLAGNKEQEKLLALLFPLNFYLWGLDHV